MKMDKCMLHANLKLLLKKVIKAKQKHGSWKNKQLNEYSLEDFLHKLEWYRLSGIQDTINYILGKIQFSDDGRFEVKEILRRK